jgi:hypothetical protein
VEILARRFVLVTEFLMFLLQMAAAVLSYFLHIRSDHQATIELVAVTVDSPPIAYIHVSEVYC